MTKTKTSKTIAFIIAFAMVFTLFSFMGTAYANDTQEQIEVVNNSSLQAEIAACPAYYDKTITDVIPGTYSKVQLKITDYVPSEEEIKDLEDFDEVKGRTITNRQYIKIDLLADGNPVMEKLNWGGLDVYMKLENDDNYYLMTKLCDSDYPTVYSTPSRQYLNLYSLSSFDNMRIAIFRIKISGDISDGTISGIVDKTYTGKNITQKSIALKVDGKTLKAGSDYEIGYWDNKAVGTCTMYFKGKGIYTGFCTMLFDIMPAKATIKSLVAKKKSLTVNIAKKAAKYGTKKFQVRYKIKGTNKWKTKTTTSRTPTLKKLKKGKRYVVQVRAYKDNYYVGKWSAAKTSKKIK